MRENKRKMSETPGIWAKPGAIDQGAFYEAVIAALRSKLNGG
jgi:hypothetical protein